MRITIGWIIFEDKKFRGFRGYLVNLENKYPRNFLYIRLDFFVQHVVGNSKWLYGSTSNEKSKLFYRRLLAVYLVQSLQAE